MQISNKTNDWFSEKKIAKLEQTKIRRRSSSRFYVRFIYLLYFPVALGWNCTNTKCYRFFDHQVTWYDAQTACQSKGATLVAIKSKEENDFIEKIILTDSWIGLNDIAEAGDIQN